MQMMITSRSSFNFFPHFWKNSESDKRKIPIMTNNIKHTIKLLVFFLVKNYRTSVGCLVLEHDNDEEEKKNALFENNCPHQM